LFLNLINFTYLGAHNWDPLLYVHLVQDYGIEVDVAQHLANNYGDRAFVVARLCKMTGKRCISDFLLLKIKKFKGR